VALGAVASGALQAAAKRVILSKEAYTMAAAVDSILGPGALDALEGADGLCHGLPRGAYTSEAFLALEAERVFARNWAFVEFAHALPGPGDMVPLTLAGLPILLVRDKTGGVQAFHNVCRHRGHSLVDKPCRGKKFIICPYHAWRYGLDGGLKATPHFAGYHDSTPTGFQAADHGLKPIRVGVWHDWIFVNLDGQAPPLADSMAPLAAQLEGLDFAKVTPLVTLDFGVVQANWKFLVENFVEPYHVPFVHSRSASGQPLGDHRMIIDGACFGCAVDVAEAPAKKRTDALAMSSRYLALFPNFIFGRYFPDELGVYVTLPEGPGRTRQRRAIYHVGDDPPDAATLEGLKRLWSKVHGEDHAMVEGLQRGRASPVLDDGGLLSPHWETAIRHFHKLIADAVR
jgi:choline monooxygenase